MSLSQLKQQNDVIATQSQNKQSYVSALYDLKNIIRNINTNKKVKIDTTRTQYPVIKIVATANMNWALWTKQDQKDEANIFWVDTYITQQYLRKLRPYQRVNHFPGSYQLGRKNNLALNLAKLRKKMPNQYNFFPQTWLLPNAIEDFRKTIKKYDDLVEHYFIAKPQAQCQGRGIYLFNDVQRFCGRMNENIVVQQYISNPYLIQGLKFDFRIYVLIKNLSPLKIFIYKQGLTRLATTIYESPKPQNIQNLTMHLTNYAINKKSPNFIFNNSQNQDNVGHKRSYSYVMNLLKQAGKNTSLLQTQIDQIIVKTILSTQNKMLSLYRDCRQKQLNSICFQILGFDIMIDSNFKPYLIQVNHSPSFTTDTPLDFAIKKNLILDTFNLLNISQKQKKQFLRSKDIEQNSRIKNLLNKDYMFQEYEYENKHLGGYRRIYPVSNNPNQMKIYTEILKLNSQGITKKKVNNSNIEKGNNIKEQRLTSLDVLDNLSYLQDFYLKYNYSKQIKKKKQDQLLNSYIQGFNFNFPPTKPPILKRNQIIQKKKNSLNPIKLKHVQIINFFASGIYSNYPKLKIPSIQTISKHKQSFPTSSTKISTYQSSNKIFKSKKHKNLSAPHSDKQDRQLNNINEIAIFNVTNPKLQQSRFHFYHKIPNIAKLQWQNHIRPEYVVRDHMKNTTIKKFQFKNKQLDIEIKNNTNNYMNKKQILKLRDIANSTTMSFY